MSVLAVIPAKGTSRRILAKNTRSFLGEPALVMTLRALETLHFDRVVVSSDDDAIGALASRHGAVYYKRSPETCTDDSPMVDAVLEVIRHYDTFEWDYVVMAYAVAPFIDPMDIVNGLDKLRTGKWPVVYPIYRAHEDPERALFVNGDYVMPRYPEWTETNSQGLRRSYHSAGQWYVADVGWLLENRTFTPAKAGYIEIPQERAVDIDTIADWKRAEILYLMDRLPGFYEHMTEAVYRMMDEEYDPKEEDPGVNHAGFAPRRAQSRGDFLGEI